jgi:hypothetical protein
LFQNHHLHKHADPVQGEPINVDFPISHTFSRKITPGDPRRAFPTQIIVSNLDKELLPLQLDQGMIRNEFLTGFCADYD